MTSGTSSKGDPPLAPEQIRALAGALAQVDGMGADVVVEKLGGGYSNVTLLVKSGARDVIVRMPPPGASNLKSGAHDVIREARILEKLHPVYALAPKPLAIVDDAGVIGVPFFAMERVRGRVLRNKVPEGLDLSPPVMRTLSTGFVDALAALHAIDVERAGLTGIGKPVGYVQRQVDGWRERYEKARTDEISDMERLAAWLRAHVPTTVGRVSVVHNDFKYDNVVLDESMGIVGVLDWELSTVGDPMTDLATSLAYWTEPGDDPSFRAMPVGPTWLEGNLTRTQIVARYEEKTGRPVEDLLFHVLLASFKIAVIAQQIYFRYAKGFTQDPRFAALGFAVAVVAAKACRVLDAGRIDVP